MGKKEEKHLNKIQARIEIFDSLELKVINQTEASKSLKLSVRQIRRLAKRYKRSGVQGLLSKKIGVFSKLEGINVYK